MITLVMTLPRGSIDESNWDSKLYSSPAHHTSFVRKLLCKKRAVQTQDPTIWVGESGEGGPRMFWLRGQCCHGLVLQQIFQHSYQVYVAVPTAWPFKRIISSAQHCTTMKSLMHISSEVQRITIIVWHKICNFGLQISSMKEVLLQCDEVDLCCSRRLVEVHKS